MTRSRLSFRTLAAALLLTGGPVTATDFTFYEPEDGGTIQIGLKGLTDTCEWINVQIDADDSADDKAEKVKNAINSSCADVFTATVDGDTVTVKNNAHQNQTVFISVKDDDTGEKDQIKDDNTYFWSTDTWYEPKGTCEGISRDGVNQGTLTIGTSRHVAVIDTAPGQPPIEVLAAALAELNAHGLDNVELVDLGDGQAALRWALTGEDAYIEFGADDLGLTSSLETRYDNPCPADIDGSGNVDVNDLVMVVLAWGTGTPQADTNLDGTVDINDLVDVIVGWGPCAESPTGACCLPDGSCAQLTSEGCDADGGTFQGDDTGCAADACVIDPGDCCSANGTPGCGFPECQNAVCVVDPFCCDTDWDAICAQEAQQFPECGCISE